MTPARPRVRRLVASLLLAASVAACDDDSSAPPASSPGTKAVPATTDPPPSSTAAVATTSEPPPTAAPTTAAAIADPVEELLAEMTLAEKIGQMTLVDRTAITPEEATEWNIGAILSGGGGAPTVNDPASWRSTVAAYHEAALATRLAIPILYGVDAVHGAGTVRGATVFPHNVGLGAANDPLLVEMIGRVTATEMAATGMRWNYAPVVAVPAIRVGAHVRGLQRGRRDRVQPGGGVHPRAAEHERGRGDAEALHRRRRNDLGHVDHRGLPDRPGRRR